MRLLFLALLFSILPGVSQATPPEQRVLYITVTEAGRVTVGGGDSIDVSDVPKQVKDALFKSSLGNRKYYKISITRVGENIPDGTLNSLNDMIRQGQQAALDAICLEKFKQLYSELDDKKQEKLRKQYPVLFQREY